jgi:chromosome segregation ATPase
MDAKTQESKRDLEFAKKLETFQDELKRMDKRSDDERLRLEQRCVEEKIRREKEINEILSLQKEFNAALKETNELKLRHAQQLKNHAKELAQKENHLKSTVRACKADRDQKIKDTEVKVRQELKCEHDTKIKSICAEKLHEIETITRDYDRNMKYLVGQNAEKAQAFAKDLENLKSDNERKQTTIKALQKELDQAKQQADSSGNDLAELSYRVIELQRDLSERSEALSLLTSEKAELTMRCDALEKSVSVFRVKLAGLGELEKQNGDLKKQIEMLQSTSVDNQANFNVKRIEMLSNIVKEKKLKSENEKKLIQIQTENSNLRASIQKFKSELTEVKFRADCNNIVESERFTQLKAKYEKLEQKTSQVSRLEDCVRQLQLELDRVNKLNQELVDQHRQEIANINTKCKEESFYKLKEFLLNNSLNGETLFTDENSNNNDNNNNMSSTPDNNVFNRLSASFKGETVEPMFSQEIVLTKEDPPDKDRSNLDFSNDEKNNFQYEANFYDDNNKNTSNNSKSNVNYNNRQSNSCRLSPYPVSNDLVNRISVVNSSGRGNGRYGSGGNSGGYQGKRLGFRGTGSRYNDYYESSRFKRYR